MNSVKLTVKWWLKNDVQTKEMPPIQQKKKAQQWYITWHTHKFYCIYHGNGAKWKFNTER